MPSVFLSLALIIGIGCLLRLSLGEADSATARRIIGLLALQVLLPALVFRVVVQVPSGDELWRIPLTMLLGTLATLGLAMAVFSLLPLAPMQKGALVLASSFGNVTYLGLPLLQGLFPVLGLQAAKVAVLCEVTTTPLNLSVGLSTGARYAAAGASAPPAAEGAMALARRMLGAMAQMPALWALLIGLLWRGSGLAVPGFLLQASNLLGQAVSGLMMLSLGLGLRFTALKHPAPLLLSAALKLLISPLLILVIARWAALAPPYLEAVVMEGAMPSQLLTLVIAERAGLNGEQLALAILISTAASFFTLPLVQWALLGH
jgi:hypothetical protein